MTPNVSITLLRTQTDERLVALVAAGHERAFDAIVERYSRPLLRHARRMLREDGRAEDVVQAAFVSAWTALGEGTAVRDLRPWLYRIVHNGALNAMKKPGGDDAPLIESQATGPGPEAEVLQREDVRRALDTISGLPERQRAALLAVALEGRSHADVGADLGIDDTAVRQLVSRARRSLRIAATAVTPWPVAVWLAGAGGAQAGEATARAGEIVGGIGAGTLFGGGAMKAGAIVAATGAVAVGAPQVAQVVREEPRAAKVAPASATPSVDGGAANGQPGAGGTIPGTPSPASNPGPAEDDDESRREPESEDRGERERERNDESAGQRQRSGRSHDGRDGREDDDRSDDRSGRRERSGKRDDDRSGRGGREADEKSGYRDEHSGEGGGKSRSDDEVSSGKDDTAGDGDRSGPGERPSREAEPREEVEIRSGREHEDRKGEGDRSDDSSVTFGR